MPVSPLRSANAESAVLTADLGYHATDWILDNEIRQLSEEVLTTRRMIVSKLVWFLSRKELESCGKAELRQFFAYMSRGHEEPGGAGGIRI